ncbi:MAG TPA: sulfotransferase, partial [Croceibacterium sp.]|nr:sulfotransferase [Croceibacterium sp.]
MTPPADGGSQSAAAGEASIPAHDTQGALNRARSLVATNPRAAAALAREVLASSPDDGAARSLLGSALARSGDTIKAIAALSDARAAPFHPPDTWRLLGDLMINAGNTEAADRAYARQIETSVYDPRLRQAALALADQNLPVAERILRDRLKQHPTDVTAIRLFAELGARIGRYGDAIKLLRRALELAPTFHAARYNLALVLYRNNQIPEALRELAQLIECEPDNLAYHNLIAVASLRIAEFDRALERFEFVLSKAPDHALTWMSYGHALKTVGRLEQAVEAYRHAIAHEPNLGEAWWSLANLKTVSFSSADIAAMEGALKDADLGEDARLHFSFALGKAHEDAGEYRRAFDAYAAGNAIRREQLSYEARETSSFVDRNLRIVTPAFLAARGRQGCLARDPIFVLGMPRSGSTLVEQILSSHSAIEGTQELPDIRALTQRVARDTGRSYPECLEELLPDELRALGLEYLERTRIQRREHTPLFIDKMPNNWQYLAFIRLILPEAKIVDVRREAMACCFSNFKQHFAKGQEFSYDLIDLGRYYRDYVRLMEHLDEVDPNAVHRVIYEELVDDPETAIRRLLNFIGVPFEADCLEFHASGRAVRTASSEQVRRPIYREGLEQWRHFGPWLKPLARALKGESR